MLSCLAVAGMLVGLFAQTVLHLLNVAYLPLQCTKPKICQYGHYEENGCNMGIPLASHQLEPFGPSALRHVADPVLRVA